MRIYAHRGVSAHLPENTLAAFASAIELGVDGIELDVQLSSDGIPVVIHDDTADRTTNGTGSIREFTARQLGLLDAGRGEFVPTLAQVLKLAAGKVCVNIELKDPTSAGPVCEVVAQVAGLDWFASSANWNSLADLAARIPNAKVYPLCIGKLEKVRAHLPQSAILEQFAGRGLAEAIAFALNNGGEGVSVCERGLEEDDIETIHSAGLQAWVWTVNDTGRALDLEKMGIDALCTDDPALIQTAKVPGTVRSTDSTSVAGN
ncbi:glycerophosphodiester phosphodiesterase family protein [Arthrobacter sp. TMP15]|uniref:glycerophosphodiester phosphodiesterase n=1 Tax=Arthrobacter sp. TMP15 TaxID=3140789 RepID=UPI0031BB44D8